MQKFFNSNVVALCLLVLAGSGCAHMASNPGSERPRSLNEVLEQDLGGNGGNPSTEYQAPQIHPSSPSSELEVLGVKLKNTKFDIPITINSRVEYWVDYFCNRGRSYFAKYLDRSEFFVPYIVPLLKQNKLPTDLVYLSMIESGFNNLARSRARAVGPWQFISATGKRYGLTVNWWVDERRDIKKSTLAAVEYLRDLYNMFGSWELAAASYNAGEAKLARAIQRYGTKDFWVISKQRFLRPETRDYVPKIIAAAIISKNREQFGFATSQIQLPADETVAPDGEIVKVVKSDKPLEDRAEPKPESNEGASASSASSASNDMNDTDDDFDDDSSDGPSITPATLTVPSDRLLSEGPMAANGNPGGPEQPLAKPVPTPHVSRSGEVGGESLAEFDVQSPADLLKVARAAGLSYPTVKSLNPELLRWCTPPTMGTYRLKLPASVKEKFLAVYNQNAFPRKVTFMSYKVHKGETLLRIASHYGIKVDPISDLNGVSSSMPLRRGLRVLLPLPDDRSRSVASLDVKDPPEHHRAHRRRRGHAYKISYKRRQSARRRAQGNT